MSFACPETEALVRHAAEAIAAGFCPWCLYPLAANGRCSVCGPSSSPPELPRRSRYLITVSSRSPAMYAHSKDRMTAASEPWRKRARSLAGFHG